MLWTPHASEARKREGGEGGGRIKGRKERQSGNGGSCVINGNF